MVFGVERPKKKLQFALSPATAWLPGPTFTDGKTVRSHLHSRPHGQWTQPASEPRTASIGIPRGSPNKLPFSLLPRLPSSCRPDLVLPRPCRSVDPPARWILFNTNSGSSQNQLQCLREASGRFFTPRTRTFSLWLSADSPPTLRPPSIPGKSKPSFLYADLAAFSWTGDRLRQILLTVLFSE